jgi:antitoxin (DNA-binding transcriptional repressor) of toxin-antitoxin stability system
VGSNHAMSSSVALSSAATRHGVTVAKLVPVHNRRFPAVTNAAPKSASSLWVMKPISHGEFSVTVSNKVDQRGCHAPT